MPTGRGTGDVRMAWKKGRKDNEYDVNFKAGWGRSNHRRLGSTIPVSTTLPAILTPHPRGLWTLTLSNYRSTFHPGGNACIMLREAASFDEARSCLAWNSTGGEKTLKKEKKKKERKGKRKKKRERMKRKKGEGGGEKEERGKKRGERLHHREFNAILNQTTLISGY